jgi:hypothetical protein
MKRKTTATRSVTKRPRRRTMTPVSSPGAIERMARETIRSSPLAKREFAMHLATLVNNNANGMLNSMPANMVAKARAMAKAAKTIQRTYRRHIDILKDEGRAILIARKIQRLIESYTDLTVSCKNKKDCAKGIEKMTGLVAGTPSDGVTSFTLKIGNMGFDPKINLQKKIAFNRRANTIGYRQMQSKPFMIGGYRIRVQFEFHVKRAVPGMYKVSKVDIVSVLIAKADVPAEVYFQSTKRAHGAEAWFDDRGRTAAQAQRVSHVFATGIIVDALLSKRPSKPKFHHVNLKRFNYVYNNRGSNANNSWSNSNNNGTNNSGINMATMAPILARLIHALKTKGYVERDSVYVTNNEGTTNTNEGRQLNRANFNARLENMYESNVN